MKNHNRVKINEAGHDFGDCRHHKQRKNEFYCNQCQSTYCSECILSGMTKCHTGRDHQLIKIETAYNIAKNQVEKNDEALEAKKVLIMDQIEIIQGKLQQIKSSAEQIQTQITRILEECMNTLMVEVQKKSAILKSDKIELSRQYKEIEFMTQFLNLQAR